MNALLRTLSLALSVSAAVACSPNVIGGGDGGDGGSGAGGSTGGSTTGGSTTGYGAGTTGYGGGTTGYGGSGGTTTWTTSSCPGPTYEWCESGTIYGECCNSGECASPPEFCDLGNGTCYLGPCNDFPDAGPPCNPEVISASSFNQTCQSDADCVAVYQGSLCTDCLCPNAAINQGALSAYTTVFNAEGPPTSICDCPAIPPPVCKGGMCTLP
jgi:hypothetical protein